VQIALPGPMTITDTTADAQYVDPARQGTDLARPLNVVIRAPVDAGCRHFQVEEPLFARNPAAALDHGIDNLNRCFDGVDGSIDLKSISTRLPL